MKPPRSALRAIAVLLAVSSFAPMRGAAVGTTVPSGYRLPGGHDNYFIENNLVYRRFLALTHDGAYEQIYKDRVSCSETDRGTWEQAADGSVRLHSTHHALRFRALLAGPLSVVLDSQEKIDALPLLSTAIQQFLVSTADAIFDVRTVDEFNASPAAVVVDRHAETYARNDLLALARQIDHAAAVERTDTYTFLPLKIPDTPTLLILQDAVFQSGDLARVRLEYRVRPSEAPPFYFARVDARTFARAIGTWTAFHFPGGPGD